MGVAISELIQGEEIPLEALQGKIVAVDAMNMLYQFVSTIRQQDGTPLKDRHGNITSHLTGLFSRVTRLMGKGIRLVFVFDGEMPALKKAERQRREKLKAEALASLEEATEKKDVANMKKFASRTSRVTPEMVNEAKELLEGLGIPVVTAPSEGEAQAAHMVVRGDCDFVASQDIDCLIYGAPKIIRNLSLSQRRKKINALTYKTILPEKVSLDNTLNTLGLTLTQLRALALLVGTDFNVGGVKGLGPKKSLKLVKEHGENLENLFSEVNFEEECGVSWKEVMEVVAHMPVHDTYSLEWNLLNKEKVIGLLVDKHDFSRERIITTLDNLESKEKLARQTQLGSFFK